MTGFHGSETKNCESRITSYGNSRTESPTQPKRRCLATKGYSAGVRSLALTFWLYSLCASSRATSVAASENLQVFQPSDWDPLKSEECPTNCEALFGKLEDGGRGGRGKVQHVEVQERGEPKSGTGVMYEWATGAIAHSCIYLQRAYGKESCRIEWTFSNRTLIFEPHLAVNKETTPPCQCSTVDRCERKLISTAEPKQN